MYIIDLQGPTTELILNAGSEIAESYSYPPLTTNQLTSLKLLRKILVIPEFKNLQGQLRKIVGGRSSGSILLEGLKGSGKGNMVESLAREEGMNYYEKDMKKVWSLEVLGKMVWSV